MTNFQQHRRALERLEAQLNARKCEACSRTDGPLIVVRGPLDHDKALPGPCLRCGRSDLVILDTCMPRNPNDPPLSDADLARLEAMRQE